MYLLKILNNNTHCIAGGCLPTKRMGKCTGRTHTNFRALCTLGAEAEKTGVGSQPLAVTIIIYFLKNNNKEERI